ncbi:MAG: hypothetical protein QOI98_2544, partial [Solirubrobacteraceae bacterium]|nr:hypothetical protein [Solirubrobacteraceae bacterium]
MHRSISATRRRLFSVALTAIVSAGLGIPASSMADTLATASTTCDELLIGNTLEGFCLAHVVCPPTASSGCVFVAVGSFQARSVTGVVGGTVRTQFPYVGYSAECGLGAGDALLSLRTYCTA